MSYSENILQEIIDLISSEIMSINNVTFIKIAEHPYTKKLFIQIGVKNHHTTTQIREVMKKYAIPEKIWDIKSVDQITLS